MDLFEAVHGRRSIRKYTEEPISEEDLNHILRAAMAAPSAGNQQPWHFILLDDREIMNSVTDYHPYAAMLPQAPLGIVICAELALEKYKGYWVQDCSAAVQNLLLAVHALGLGGVWLGVHPMADRIEETKKLFKLPKGIEPLGIIAIGHPVESKPPADRFNPERIHKNTW